MNIVAITLVVGVVSFVGKVGSIVYETVSMNFDFDLWPASNI